MINITAPTDNTIKKMQAEIQARIDAIIIEPYISPMIEVKNLCNEHREAMRCNIIV